MIDAGLQQMNWKAVAVAATSQGRKAPEMEHRWGMRRLCRASVSVSAGPGAVANGRLRNVSMSGAFIETDLPLPVFAQVSVSLRRDDGADHGIEFTATVVRTEPGGVGVEWCETADCSICRLMGCASECAAALDR